MTRPRTRKGPVAALLTVAAALLMSACSTHPGSAAVVGSETISAHQLDDVAIALCSAQAGAGQQGQQPQELASRAARRGALDVMINSALSRQYGKAQGVQADQEQISAAVDANAEQIAALPAQRRDDFEDTLREYAEGQLVLIEVGRRELAKTGAPNATEQQAVSEGLKLRNAWAEKNADVSVDPRYGKYSKNALVGASGSLSVAVSSAAEDGASPDPSAGWVTALPASQKCG